MGRDDATSLVCFNLKNSDVLPAASSPTIRILALEGFRLPNVLTKTLESPFMLKEADLFKSVHVNLDPILQLKSILVFTGYILLFLR